MSGSGAGLGGLSDTPSSIDRAAAGLDWSPDHSSKISRKMLRPSLDIRDFGGGARGKLELNHASQVWGNGTYPKRATSTGASRHEVQGKERPWEVEKHSRLERDTLVLIRQLRHQFKFPEVGRLDPLENPNT